MWFIHDLIPPEDSSVLPEVYRSHLTTTPCHKGTVQFLAKQTSVKACRDSQKKCWFYYEHKKMEACVKSLEKMTEQGLKEWPVLVTINPVRSSVLWKVELRNGLFISRPEGLPPVKSHHSDSSAEDPAFLTSGEWKVEAYQMCHSFYCMTSRKKRHVFEKKNKIKSKPKNNQTTNMHFI